MGKESRPSRSTPDLEANDPTSITTSSDPHQLDRVAVDRTIAAKFDSGDSPLPPSSSETSAPLTTLLAPPTLPGGLGQLGEYRVLGVLGEGGMGLVLRGEDPRLNRQVALKVMHAHLAQRDEFRERFLREARAAAAIEHDHVVTIFQVGESNGVPFIAMPLLKGETLDARLKRVGRLSEAETLRIAYQIASALAAAHDRGLIHRDIKPENIWLEAKSGRVKVLDFGLARFDSAESELTRVGSVLGTPSYMSPEQSLGHELDGRSDLFSLGSLMYHLLAGQPPFQGTTLAAVLLAVINETPKPLETIRSDVSSETTALVGRLLAKAKEERPARAAEVVRRLAELIRKASRPDARASAPSVGDLKASLPVVRTAPQASATLRPRTAAPPKLPAGRAAILLGGGGIFFLLLLGIIVITIRNREGKETVIRVPEGVEIDVDAPPDSKVTIRQLDDDPEAEGEDGQSQPAGPVPSPSPTDSSNASDRASTVDAALDWIESVRGAIVLRDAAGKEHFIDYSVPAPPEGRTLPTGPFDCTFVSFLSADLDAVTDESIACLAALTEIESLSLPQCRRITDRGLDFLGSLSRLKYVDLSFVPVHDETAERLARLTRLETLRLNETSIGDAGFAMICAVDHPLKEVGLSPEMTDESVLHAAALPHLEILSIKPSQATERAFDAIGTMTKLKGLNIVGADDRMVRRCGSLDRLELLTLNLCEASPEAFRELSGMTGLQELNVRDSPRLTDRHLEVIAELRQLRALKAVNVPFGAEAIAAFDTARPGVLVER